MADADELTQQLAEALRRAEREHEALEGLCDPAPPAGDATSRPELDGLAEADLLAELMRPVEQRAIVGALAQALGSVPSAALAPAAGGQPAASVTRLRPRPAWIAAPILAAAAALALWAQPKPEPIASYEAEVRGALAEVRAAPRDASPAALSIDASRTLTLVLRPQSNVAGVVNAKVYLAGDQARELAAEVERAESGALRIGLRIPASAPEAGRLCVLVGRAEELEARHVLETATSGPGWQRLSWSYQLAGR